MEDAEVYRATFHTSSVHRKSGNNNVHPNNQKLQATPRQILSTKIDVPSAKSSPKQLLKNRSSGLAVDLLTTATSTL